MKTKIEIGDIFYCHYTAKEAQEYGVPEFDYFKVVEIDRDKGVAVGHRLKKTEDNFPIDERDDQLTVFFKIGSKEKEQVLKCPLMISGYYQYWGNFKQ